MLNFTFDVRPAIRELEMTTRTVKSAIREGAHKGGKETVKYATSSLVLVQAKARREARAAAKANVAGGAAGAAIGAVAKAATKGRPGATKEQSKKDAKSRISRNKKRALARSRMTGGWLTRTGRLKKAIRYTIVDTNTTMDLNVQAMTHYAQYVEKNTKYSVIVHAVEEKLKNIYSYVQDSIKKRTQK